MTRMINSLIALILSIVLLVSGNTFLTTLLAIRLSNESVSADTIGWVLVCYSVGFVLGTLHVQKVIASVGHIRAFAVFAAIAAVTALIYPMAVSMLLWATLRIMSGFSIAGVFVVIESWFSSRATNANRGALFAIYQIVFFVAAAGGQLFVNIGDPANFMPFSLAAILLALALVPLSLTRMKAPHIEQAQRISVATLIRKSFSGVTGALTGGALISSFYALGPVYATLAGLDVARTSIFMASAVVTAMLLAWPIGRLCDRFDRRRLMFWVALATAVIAAAIGLLNITYLPLLTLLTALFIGLSATLYPTAVAITNDRTDATRIVAASATLLLTYGIGSVIGPIVMAQLINLLGPEGLFLGNAGFLLLLAVITGYHISHTKDVPIEEQEHFVPTMPETSPVLTKLDPRNDQFQASPEAMEMEEEQKRTHKG
ncbi:Predicted arabinose efflux permease, MFS family [Nitrosomonas sp. Nm51]|uniref:MFS transporter n=1 Tax=Nitrosomonas sp. Nm51 TaxID=133720 RepID=UPI0008B0ECCF|nr:MFS transporter [Nitrosomonas sp. Nm51]SEQ90478.1 Predicted arabinose efflux permease, MFS family [Nitrosomonas sp. Nm51]